MKNKKNITRIVSLREINEEFERLTKSAFQDAYITTSRRILSLQANKIMREVRIAKALKEEIIKEGDELKANSLLYIQLVYYAIYNLIETLIHLKNEKPRKAWGCIVSAEEYLAYAQKVLKVTNGDERQQKSLELIGERRTAFEDAFFPGNAMYNSPGFIESIGICSICGEGFISCDHVEENIYMGRVCKRIRKEIIHADHFALVKNPRDRRCIFLSSKDCNGNKIDKFTREPIKEERKDKGSYEVVLYAYESIDIF